MLTDQQAMMAMMFGSIMVSLSKSFDVEIVRWIDAGVNSRHFLTCDAEGFHCLGIAMDIVVRPSSREADFIRACREVKFKTVDFIDYIHVEM